MSTLEPVKLNRFTSFEELNDLLRSKTITLTNPTKWQDKNDIRIIKECEKQKGKKIFLKCFCGGNETIHHWHSFAKNRKGCCIQFNTEKLLKYIIAACPGVEHRRVKYKYISEIMTDKPSLDLYPFIKRKPYHVENEYRVVYFGNKKESVKQIPIKLDCITKITLSPLISEEVFKTKRASLRKTYNIKRSDTKINKSTVYLNKEWISLFC